MENLEKPVFLSCKKQIIQVICIANQSIAEADLGLLQYSRWGAL